jgi:hypothetical protein
MDAPWPWKHALERLEVESKSHFSSEAARTEAFQSTLCSIIPAIPSTNPPDTAAMRAWVISVFHFDAFEGDVPKAWSMKMQRKCLPQFVRQGGNVRPQGKPPRLGICARGA